MFSQHVHGTSIRQLLADHKNKDVVVDDVCNPDEQIVPSGILVLSSGLQDNGALQQYSQLCDQQDACHTANGACRLDTVVVIVMKCIGLLLWQVRAKSVVLRADLLVLIAPPSSHKLAGETAEV